MTYQGWTNHATWALYTEIGNSEPMYMCWRDRAHAFTLEDLVCKLIDVFGGQKEWGTVNWEELADALKDF